MTARTTSFPDYAWPPERLGEALLMLSRESGLGNAYGDVPRAPTELFARDESVLARWLESIAARLEVEVDPVAARLSEMEDFVTLAGPAIVEISSETERAFVALLRDRLGSKVFVVAPDSTVRTIEEQELCDALIARVYEPVRERSEQWVERLNLKEGERERAVRALARTQLGAHPVARAWLVRHRPSANMLRQLVHAGAFRYIGWMLLAFTAELALGMIGWGLVGQNAFEGHMDRAWIWTWILFGVSAIPFSLLTTWASGRLAVSVGALLKTRLLAGAMKLEPEEIRHLGTGGLLGTMLDAEAFEGVVLSNGFAALSAVIQLFAASGVLAAGASGALSAVALLLWTVVTVVLGAQYFRSRSRWTATRLAMTQGLVERMLGYRTRLVQEAPETMHEEEDKELDRYIALSRDVDARALRFSGLVTRGWTFVGICTLAPVVFSSHANIASIAIALGGIMLARDALGKITQSSVGLGDLVIAWRRIKLLFSAATRDESVQSGAAFAALTLSPQSASERFIEAHNVTFRHAGRAEPVLSDVNLTVRRGDRILLEGASGGGKSTLASLLAGSRKATSGLMLLRGLDRHTVGAEAWRTSVSIAPQFHDNHILSNTLAFNLLMGRQWPPSENDLAEAEELCRELGLGPLLEQMPAGISQMVGETGWQLSHGEKSRVFLARALLSRSDMIVLDESFGALDPKTMGKCLETVMDRAPTLLVIAHP